MCYRENNVSIHTVTNPSVLSDDRLLSDFLGEHHCFVKLGNSLIDKLEKF